MRGERTHGGGNSGTQSAREKSEQTRMNAKKERNGVQWRSKSGFLWPCLGHIWGQERLLASLP